MNDKIKHLHFFLGADTAPSESQTSDDGALVIAAAWPKHPPVELPDRNRHWSEEDKPLLPALPADWHFGYVYARRVTWKNKLSGRQWSGLIHDLHRRFQFSGIMMDPGGGGIWVKREMIDTHQVINGAVTEVVPLGDTEGDAFKVARGNFIVHLFKRGDPGIDKYWPMLAGDEMLNDAGYSMLKSDFENSEILMVPPIEHWMGQEHRQWFDSRPNELQRAIECLDAIVAQMAVFYIETGDDDIPKTTARGAKMFGSIGKKDLLSAALFSRTMFQVWLRVKLGWDDGAEDVEQGNAFMGTMIR